MAPTGQARTDICARTLSSSVTGCRQTWDIPFRSAKVSGANHSQAPQSMQVRSTKNSPGTLEGRLFCKLAMEGHLEVSVCPDSAGLSFLILGCWDDESKFSNFQEKTRTKFWVPLMFWGFRGQGPEGYMKKIVVVVFFLLALMPYSNPDKQAFDQFILVHVKEGQHLKKGAFQDQLFSFFGPVVIDQISSRKDYFFFSIYTLNLPQKPPRHFLGIYHIFLPV